MNKNVISLSLSAAMILASCNCEKKVQAIDPANMDTTVAAGDDFYRYADGGWMDANPLKPEHSRFGTFDLLREQSEEQVKELIINLSKQQNAQGSIAQKIGDLYDMAMDTARLNSEGVQPLLPYLKQVEAISDKSELSALIATMLRNGASPFFTAYVYADDMNSSMNIFHLMQGGYSMGDRDYYLENDSNTQQIRAKYTRYIETLFTLCGYSEVQAQQASAAVMRIETALATAAYSRVELRDPVANYHKITVEELSQQAPAIDWKVFFQTIGIEDIHELNLAQLKPIAEVSRIIESESLQDIQYYLLANLINNAAAMLLNEALDDANFDYYSRTLSGVEKQRDRWKRAVGVINGTLGEAVGQLYVDRYFPPAAKEKMLNLVHNLQTALGERIQDLTWMGDETKAQALEKLAAFHIKIGYPDKWRDYSALEIDKNLSLLDNMMAASRFEYDYMISKFNKPVDKDEWLMNPQTVNAYYNPATNEICFPAAILQPPFFFFDADDAVNYGAIGVVIGHEMTHGFDDQGRQFDKDGNLKAWWTPEDAARFQERAQVLVDFYDQIVVIDTVHANGSLTLGENIADQGGLQVSWQAYQNTLKDKPKPAPIDGFTDAQRFFLSYATVWAGNIRDAEILHRTKTDPHSLGQWRVNGALPHIDAWYDAFDVTPENKLYVPKAQRVAIW
ncbi:MAG: M13 family metallopeptidase [Dysgonamonadaceae bacterium]|jgi:putative endopeptidase|nr:M13 family metallopeptidase [Dysgonamonadaceae bacterium]